MTMHSLLGAHPANNEDFECEGPLYSPPDSPPSPSSSPPHRSASPPGSPRSPSVQPREEATELVRRYGTRSSVCLELRAVTLMALLPSAPQGEELTGRVDITPLAQMPGKVVAKYLGPVQAPRP